MEHAEEFLHALAQALSALSLYPDGHASRERALDAAYEKLVDLLSKDASPSYSFLGEEVVYGTIPLREMRGWEWSVRLSNVGLQRLEFDNTATRDDLEYLLDDTLGRLALGIPDTSEARQMRELGIRWGEIGVRGDEDREAEAVVATLELTLGEEAETIRWLHQEVAGGSELPLAEADAVVRGLSVAMHGDREMLLPLLKIRKFDEYTTTHSLNVCVLAMAFAEWLELDARDVRAFGIAGLLHDLGKVKIPLEILNKKGKFDDNDRAVMNAHPVEGARIIIESHPHLNLASVVAYEHHIMLNGGGYPKLTYERECHRASKIVHVCDVYDALRTERPYRAAWPSGKVLSYIEERSGAEFDGNLAHSFTRMMRMWEPQVARVDEHEHLPVS